MLFIGNRLTVVDGQIRFITLSDTGTNENLMLAASAGATNLNIPVIVESARPTAISVYDDNGNDPNEPDTSMPSPELKISGLGNGNQLTESPLIFSVDSDSQLDAEVSVANIYVPADQTIYSLSDKWIYDSTLRTFTLSTGVLATILGTLPSEELELNVTINSVDGT